MLIMERGRTVQNATDVSKDSKNMAMLVWILTLFFGFIPGLIFFLTKKDDPYVLDQSQESLNWSITAIFGYMISFVLVFIVIGTLTMLAVWIAHIVFCIMGAVATSNGKPFRVPFAVRLIK